MNISFLRLSELLLVIAPLTLVLFGCVVEPGDGYISGEAVGPGYYEPYGAYYGGWEPGYQVAPYRNGYYNPGSGSGRPVSHAYRAAASSRSVPSLPSASRSGGERVR